MAERSWRDLLLQDFKAVRAGASYDEMLAFVDAWAAQLERQEAALREVIRQAKLNGWEGERCPCVKPARDALSTPPNQEDSDG